MSSYLLLRNNQESGPFTLDEVKIMPLKSYDLIWVVGKSASWRYPGEIPELKSFAPSLPDQQVDFFLKRTSTESNGSDSSSTKIPDSPNSQRLVSNGQRPAVNRSVYINLPAEKKSGSELSGMMVEDSLLNASDTPRSEYELSEIYKQQPSAAVRYSGKILWVSTIILLFGAGIMTGLFISDRRKFFSSDENHPQNNSAMQEVVYKDKKENTTSANSNSSNSNNEIISLNTDSVKKTTGITKRQNNGSSKKLPAIITINKDSVAAEQALLTAIRLKDSVNQEAVRKSELLYQAIRANPEKYLNLSTGHYSTGLFGGISSFPVTITNNSPVKIGLVEVTIDYIQNNSKVFKTETLSFNNLDPGEVLTMKAPKSARGTKITSQIHIINLHQTDPGSTN